MDRILNRVYSIKNHPISGFDEPFRLIYVKGLASCLFSLSNGSEIIKMVFRAWAQSILGVIPYDELFWHNDIKAIKQAVSIHHKGLHFFSMKNSLFFDVFYLIQSEYPHCFEPSVAKNAFIFLSKNACNLFIKGSLKKTYQFYTENTLYRKISSSLLDHRLSNESFLDCPTKNVLIVANVSAGKSTLINALIGYRLNVAKTTACTSKIGYIYNKPIEDGITTRDEHNGYHHFSNVEEVNSDTFQAAALHFNSTLSKYSICFIDTPGVNDIENKRHKMITEEAIKAGDYDAVIYVSNCQYFGTNDEYNLLVTLKDNVKKPIIFILNQLDRFKQKEDSISKMLIDYQSDLKKMGFSKSFVVPVSARAALFLKVSEDMLDEDDIEERRSYHTQFQNPYYNLPAYCGVLDCNDALSSTGIQYLENLIETLLFT